MEERKIANQQEAEKFIAEQTEAIKNEVGGKMAIGFVSGGVDSSVVAVLGRLALGSNLRLFFIQNGLMRAGEVELISSSFIRWLVSPCGRAVDPIRFIDAEDRFFAALAGKITPFDKRTAIREIFYGKILPELIQEWAGAFLLQGTTLTDIQATAKGSAAPQHNVLAQIGIETQVRLIEPLKQLHKPSVRQVAKALGLPKAIWARMPFPGPGLAARIVGEVTREKVDVIRRATVIVEKALGKTGAFQYFPVLISDMVPNNDRTRLGYAIAIVCVESENARTARPFYVDEDWREKIRNRIYREIPEILRVCWDMSPKPPAAIEWV